MITNKVIIKLPPCPKCNSIHTTDEQPLKEEEWLFPIEEPRAFEKGKARYYCLDCAYTWKNIEGKSRIVPLKESRLLLVGFLGHHTKLRSILK